VKRWIGIVTFSAVTLLLFADWRFSRHSGVAWLKDCYTPGDAEIKTRRLILRGASVAKTLDLLAGLESKKGDDFDAGIHRWDGPPVLPGQVRVVLQRRRFWILPDYYCEVQFNSSADGGSLSFVQVTSGFVPF